MQRVVLATSNAGKACKLASLLEDFGLSIIARTGSGVGSAEETGLTFVEDVILRARHTTQITGLPIIIGDSGLAADTPGGASGIYSARYSGVDTTDQQNLGKLLGALKGMPDDQHQAQFHRVLVCLHHAEDPTPLVCHGSWPGIIAQQAIGVGGFGCDPILFIPPEGKIAAEPSRGEESTVSHHGQALRLLLEASRNG